MTATEPCVRCGRGGHDFRTPAGDVECNRLFMADPDRWPGWPLLPLKHGPEEHNRGFGLLFDDGDKPTVLLTNVFQFNADAERVQYEDLGELLAAGWRVD